MLEILSDNWRIVLMACAGLYTLFSFCLVMIIRFGSEDGLPSMDFDRSSNKSRNPMQSLGPTLDLSSKVLVDLSAVTTNSEDSGYRSLNRWYNFNQSMPADNQSLDATLGLED